MKKRYPTGWGGAAAMFTEDGKILMSIAPEVINAGTELCIGILVIFKQLYRERLFEETGLKIDEGYWRIG